MKIFYDLEFNERCNPIDFLSIGMVDEEGNQLYRILREDAAIDRVLQDSDRWLRNNVLKYFPIVLHPECADDCWEWNTNHEDYKNVVTHRILTKDVKNFVLSKNKPELWAYYSAYDHVVMCRSLFGTMMNLPQGFPMFTNDIMTFMKDYSGPMPDQPIGSHNALEDALFNVVRAKRLGII